MRRRVVRAAASALVLLLAVPACGETNDSVGALGTDAGRVEQCTPVEGDSPVVFGDEFLGNVSSHPVRIDAIRLVRAEGLTIRDAFLLPYRNKTHMGTVPFPPDFPTWPDRREAIGAELAPGEDWNLALTLDRSGQPTKFTDVEVAYSVGDDSTSQRLGYAVTFVEADPARPPETWCQPPYYQP